jgi:hypothetical protein
LVLLIARALGEGGADVHHPAETGDGEQRDDPAANGRHDGAF